MNVHPRDIEDMPDNDEAAAALKTLRKWAESATEAEISQLDPAIARLVPGLVPVNYPSLSREYPDGFTVDSAYRATLPDLQNGTLKILNGLKHWNSM